LLLSLLRLEHGLLSMSAAPQSVVELVESDEMEALFCSGGATEPFSSTRSACRRLLWRTRSILGVPLGVVQLDRRALRPLAVSLFWLAAPDHEERSAESLVRLRPE